MKFLSRKRETVDLNFFQRVERLSRNVMRLVVLVIVIEGVLVFNDPSILIAQGEAIERYKVKRNLLRVNNMILRTCGDIAYQAKLASDEWDKFGKAWCETGSDFVNFFSLEG